MENGLLKKRVARHIQIAKLVADDARLQENVDRAAAAISECYARRGKILVMGNGGSAADAQHMAAEFVGKYLKERKALPAAALTANSSSVTAIGNDYSFDHIFQRQVEGMARKGDVVVGISTSGNSPNVVQALAYAKANGIMTIGLTGTEPCGMDKVSDIQLKVPSNETPFVQEMHMMIIHTICEMVENDLVEKKII
jgi:D-sedoheptulose 7-phosphate isomerase